MLSINLNSVYGGIIIPRGTSLVGLDLRKTKIRPKYIPNPENDNIERSAIFRVTGACYFWQYSILDGDPSSVVYKDYTNNTFVPNFSHHKLTCFEYADGRNAVDIDDAFLTYSTTRTDLDMYYEKVGLVYGPSSGREIEPDYPSLHQLIFNQRLMNIALLDQLVVKLKSQVFFLVMVLHLALKSQLLLQNLLFNLLLILQSKLMELLQQDIMDNML
jgi:hypothetical protein